MPASSACCTRATMERITLQPLDPPRQCVPLWCVAPTCVLTTSVCHVSLLDAPHSIQFSSVQLSYLAWTSLGIIFFLRSLYLKSSSGLVYFIGPAFLDASLTIVLTVQVSAPLYSLLPFCFCCFQVPDRDTCAGIYSLYDGSNKGGANILSPIRLCTFRVSNRTGNNVKIPMGFLPYT